MTTSDAVIVGAGPSGAATALLLARAGHSVTILDRARFPRDKACGEGLMPSGVAVLRRLGLHDAVVRSGARRIEGVAYTHPGGGPTAYAAFPPPPGGGASWGLGVRRTAFDPVLVDALRGEPRVTLLEATTAVGVVSHRGRTIGVRSAAAEHRGHVVIAADGLHSRIRAAAGWTPASADRRGRYGIVSHWRTDTRGHDRIVICLAGTHEWYLAPVGPDLLVVSLLGRRRQVGTAARDFAATARRAVPAIRDAEQVGAPLAAGQFLLRPGTVASSGLFLVGDAAGYHDPTTGEGLSLGMLLAERLATWVHLSLTGAITGDDAEAGYRRDHARLWRDRRRVTRLALLMAANPSLSRRAVGRATDRPATLGTLLGINCGYWGFGRLTPRDWLALAGV